MFFPRLRKQVKWVYIFLAVVFAGGFVFLGVGSGSTGIGDLLQGNFDLFGHGSSGTSIGKAQDRVKKHPNDPAAYRDLATALETKGKTDDAIGALESYTRLRPKDSDALRELGGLYLTRADRFRADAQNAQIDAQAALAASTFAPASTKLAQAIGSDPIIQAISDKVNKAVSDAYSKQQSAYGAAVSVYQKIVALHPNDPSVQLELASASESAGNSQVAIGAYKAFLKLAPEDPSAPAVKQRIKQLQTPAVGQAPTG
jgi:regulator of sirC expression with transglutaminase-like and TPR domain